MRKGSDKVGTLLLFQLHRAVLDFNLPGFLPGSLPAFQKTRVRAEGVSSMYLTTPLFGFVPV